MNMIWLTTIAAIILNGQSMTYMIHMVLMEYDRVTWYWMNMIVLLDTGHDMIDMTYMNDSYEQKIKYMGWHEYGGMTWLIWFIKVSF